MKFDIIVIGGGLVGASLAVALKDSGLKIALIESRLPAPLPEDKSWDSRIYAISPGSAAFFAAYQCMPGIGCRPNNAGTQHGGIG